MSVNFSHGIFSSLPSVWSCCAARNSSYSWLSWSSRIWSSLFSSRLSPSFFAYFGPFKPSCRARVTAYFYKQKRRSILQFMLFHSREKCHCKCLFRLHGNHPSILEFYNSGVLVLSRYFIWTLSSMLFKLLNYI